MASQRNDFFLIPDIVGAWRGHNVSPFHSNLYSAHRSPCFVGFRALFNLFMTAHVQPTSTRNCHSPNWRQRLGNGHLSMSPRISSLPLGIGSNDRGPPIKWSSEPLCICLYPGLNLGPLYSKASVLSTRPQWPSCYYGLPLALWWRVG